MNISWNIFKSKNVIYSHFLPDIDNDVKHDLDVKQATFYVAISSYLKSTLNETVKGESGIGKTFVVKQILPYFPQDKIHYIGSDSPTSFYHDHGVLMSKDGTPINTDNDPKRPIKNTFKTVEEFEESMTKYIQAKKEWNKLMDGSYKLIDFRNRILFFLDAESQGFKKMLPLLSHDAETIEFNYTDKTLAYGMKTVHVKTQGFPVAIFAMTERDMGKREGKSNKTSILCVARRYRSKSSGCKQGKSTRA